MFKFQGIGIGGISNECISAKLTTSAHKQSQVICLAKTKDCVQTCFILGGKQNEHGSPIFLIIAIIGMR